MSRNNAGLSADRIVAEALHIIDGQGLRRLTMRRLGDALEVEAMAIYHHFPLGKEQLFDAIVEHISDVAPSEDGPADEEAPAAAQPGDAEPPDQDARPWDERLRSWAHDYRAQLLRHSGALALILNRRPDTPAAMRALDLHYRAFDDAGVPRETAVVAAAALDAYVLGAVIGHVRSEGAPSSDPAVIDGRYPHVAARRDVRPDPDTQFDTGFAAVLDGIRARLT